MKSRAAYFREYNAKPERRRYLTEKRREYRQRVPAAQRNGRAVLYRNRAAFTFAGLVKTLVSA